MLVHTSVITFEEKKTGMIKKVYILMKKPYSLAQEKWLKQIQYFPNLQAFNSRRRGKAAWV